MTDSFEIIDQWLQTLEYRISVRRLEPPAGVVPGGLEIQLSG
jgi:hypothetical protein